MFILGIFKVTKKYIPAYPRGTLIRWKCTHKFEVFLTVVQKSFLYNSSLLWSKQYNNVLFSICTSSFIGVVVWGYHFGDADACEYPNCFQNYENEIPCFELMKLILCSRTGSVSVHCQSEFQSGLVSPLELVIW